MQAVTVEILLPEEAQKLFTAHQYSDYLYFHGLAVQIVEALAESVHARIAESWGFAGEESGNLRDILAQRYRGSRYSSVSRLSEYSGSK